MPKRSGSGDDSVAPKKKRVRKPKKIGKCTTKAQREARTLANRVRNPFKTCSFLTNKKTPCKAVVWKTDTGMGLHFCAPHYAKYYGHGLSWLMDAEVINVQIDELAKEKGLKIPGTVKSKGLQKDAVADKARQRVARATAMIDRFADDEATNAIESTAGRIRWAPHGNKGHAKTGGQVQVMDVDYYTPDYQSDHYLQLEGAIRRAQAMVNLRIAMLGEVQERAKEVMTVSSEGEMPIGTPYGVEQGVTKNKTTKPMSFYELQLKIHEGIDKAEKRLAELLKQREDMLPCALLVLKREGIVFSRDAGQMILAIAKKEEDRPLEKYHADVNAMVKAKPVTMDVPLEAPTQLDSDDDW